MRIKDVLGSLLLLALFLGLAVVATEPAGEKSHVGKRVLRSDEQDVQQRGEMLHAGSTDVVVATDKTLDALLANSDAIINFYSTSCLVCRYFEAIYNDVAAVMKTKNPDLRFFKVDVSHNVGASIRFLLSSVPSIYLVTKDKTVVQVGQRMDPAEMMKSILSTIDDYDKGSSKLIKKAKIFHPFSLHVRCISYAATMFLDTVSTFSALGDKLDLYLFGKISFGRSIVFFSFFVCLMTAFVLLFTFAFEYTESCQKTAESAQTQPTEKVTETEKEARSVKSGSASEKSKRDTEPATPAASAIFAAPEPVTSDESGKSSARVGRTTKKSTTGASARVRTSRSNSSRRSTRKVADQVEVLSTEEVTSAASNSPPAPEVAIETPIRKRGRPKTKTDNIVAVETEEVAKVTTEVAVKPRRSIRKKTTTEA